MFFPEMHVEVSQRQGSMKLHITEKEKTCVRSFIVWMKWRHTALCCFCPHHAPKYNEAQQPAHRVLMNLCVRVQPQPPPPPVRSLSQHALFSTLLHNGRAESNRQLPALNNYGKQAALCTTLANEEMLYLSQSICPFSQEKSMSQCADQNTQDVAFLPAVDKITKLTEGLVIYNTNTNTDTHTHNALSGFKLDSDITT